MPPYTKNGYVVDDNTRLAAIEGDGRAYPDSSFYGPPAYTNLIANGGIETNTTGWLVNSTNTIARSTAKSKFGSASLLVTVVDAPAGCVTYCSVTITAVEHTYSVWIYIPASVNAGTIIRAEAINFTGMANAIMNADMTKRDQWQQVSVTFTPDAGDVTGTVGVRANPTTAGDTFYVDGAQLTTGRIVLPYAHTDGGTVAKVAGNVLVPNWLLDDTQGGMAIRLRTGFPNTAGPTGSASPRTFQFQYPDGSNIIYGYFFETNNRWHTNRVDAGGGGPVASNVDAFAKGDIRTIVHAWTPTEVKVKKGTDAFIAAANTRNPIGPAANLNIAGPSTTTAALYGNVLWAVFFKGTITDAEANIFAALPDSGIDASMLPSTIGITGFTDFNADDQVAYYPFDPYVDHMFDRWALASVD